MKYMDCDFCGSRDFHVWGASVAIRTLHSVMVRCKNCGLFYTNPRASKGDLKAFYQSYWKKGGTGRFHADCLDEATWAVTERHSRERIRRYGRSGRFLDVGCGPGIVLKAARDEGYEACGVDVSRHAVEYAQRQLGFKRVFAGPLEEAGYPEGSFDVVHIWHTMEYVTNLNAFLTEVHRVLKDEGLLIIGTINISALLVRLRRWFWLLRGWVPPMGVGTEWVYAFDPGVLRRILSARGFVVKEMRVYEDNATGDLFLRNPEDGVLKGLGRKMVAHIAWFGQGFLEIGRKIEVLAIKAPNKQ